MAQPSVFIGSSSEGLEVARAIGEGLECCADPIIWDEDVFEFGRGYLEELVTELEKHDFAILILTPDDVVDSRGDSQQSPRDNVLFESGLFMGRLGRERTFIVCDRSTKMKLPSDLAGVSLIQYDGKRMGDAPSSAVRGACMRINRVLKKPPFRELTGTWRSRYLLCHDEGDGQTPLVEEEVEIKPARGMLCIESKNNPKNDNYVAYGRLAMAKHFVGEWQSTRYAATAGGAFFLTLHPQGNLMYGYYVSPGDDYKVIHGGWVMARVGLGDIMARREDDAKAVCDAKALAAAKPGADGKPKPGADAKSNGDGPPALNRDDIVKEELEKLLNQGAELLKSSAPILNKLDIASRNGASAQSKGAGEPAEVTAK